MSPARFALLSTMVLCGPVTRSSARVGAAEEEAESRVVCKKDDGYRGIWYSNQRQDDEYVYKYSGGLGTYCAKHRPLAVYAPEAGKTFFCYGGSPKKKNTLLHMVSYYDHKTGMVPRPRILVDKKTNDAHDNPVLSLDADGHLWIFSSSHGTSRPSYIWVSTKPYSIDAFSSIVGCGAGMSADCGRPETSTGRFIV